MANEPLIIVALGGNAISAPMEEGNVDEQFANSRITANALADLIVTGHRLVVTHGNGPQIGNFLLRNLAASGVVYPLPMEVAVAHVQGGMGYMIAQTLMNELAVRDREQVVTTFVTTVYVDRDDPAFANPTKPIGRLLSFDDVSRLEREEGWSTKEIQPGVFRRIVPSPHPKRIVEIESIRRAVEAGELIVACGGGGIPIVYNPDYGYHGVRAVIDKDLASALLAAELGADAMMILTNVDQVKLNFGRPDERGLEHMTVAQARQWLDEGQFPEGSMGPKIQGAINFLTDSKKPDAYVVIGPLDKAAEAIKGEVGTRITKSEEGT